MNEKVDEVGVDELLVWGNLGFMEGGVDEKVNEVGVDELQ